MADVEHADLVHDRNQIAVKAAGGMLLGEHNDALVGVAGLYEREVIEQVLELELGSTMLVGTETGLVAVDLLAKHTFFHGRPVDVFVGAGPALDVELLYGEGVRRSSVRLVPTLLTSAGGHLWLTRHLGVLLETDAGIGLTRSFTVEIEGAVGIAYRF